MKAQGSPPPPLQQAQAHELHHAEHAHEHHESHEPSCPWVQQRMQALTGKYRFCPVRGDPQPQGRGVPPSLAQLRRRPPPRSSRTSARGNQDDSIGGADEREDDERVGDKEDAEGKGGRRQAFDFQEDTERDMHGQDQRDESERRALQAEAGPQRASLSASQVLSRSSLPGTEQLSGNASGACGDPKALLASLASVLLSCGRGARPPAGAGPVPPSDTAVLLAALQAYLAEQPNAVPEPLSLDEVKALLMSDALSAIDGNGPRNPNLLLLLPLYLLNATRVRTEGQRRQAIDRLQTLRRMPGMG